MHDQKFFNIRTERRDAAENRQRILEAAMRLFEQHGVEEVSMNQIATEAKIGPGTLYRRYRNKSELCLDLIKDNLVLCFDEIERYLAQHQTAPASSRLRGLLGLFIQFRESKAQLLKGVEDASSTNQKKPGMHGPIYTELHQLLVELFDEMATDEKNQPSSVFRADMLLVALRSDAYLFQREVRGHTPEEIFNQLCLTFIPQQ